MPGRLQASDDERKLLRRETDIGNIPSPLIRQVQDYWSAKRGARALPSWSDIDPAEIKRLLPNLLVVAVEHDPLRFLFRLAGTQFVELRGDPTGYYADSIPWQMPASRASLQESYEIVIRSRAPLFAEVEIRTVNGAHRRIFGGIWPLAPRPDAPIDRCLAAEDYSALTRADLL